MGFFQRFAATYASWAPDEAGLEATKSQLHGSGRVAVRLVPGTAGGHPRFVLQTLVAAAEGLPAALEQAAALPESTPCGELALAAGLPALQSLEAACRSHHNRGVMASMGLLRALCAAGDALTRRLSELTAVLCGGGSGGGPVQAAATQAVALQLLRRCALSALLAFCSGEAAYWEGRAAAAGRPGAQQQPGSDAVSHAARAAAEGSAAAAAADAAAAVLAELARPLADLGALQWCGAVSRLSLQLRLDGSNSGGGGSSGGSSSGGAAQALEQLSLRCLLGVLRCGGGAAQAALASAGPEPWEGLLHLLGWPLAARPCEGNGYDVAERVARGAGLRPAGEEVEVQCLVLDVAQRATRRASGCPSCPLSGVSGAGIVLREWRYIYLPTDLPTCLPALLQGERVQPAAVPGGAGLPAHHAAPPVGGALGRRLPRRRRAGRRPAAHLRSALRLGAAGPAAAAAAAPRVPSGC